MEFGLFMMPVHHPGKGLQRTLKEDMDTVVLADQLGFHEAWIGEHHTIPWENLTSPDLFIAQALVKTEQIKLGTGVVLLQIQDPKMLADRIALLDHMAQGRFYLGVGTGGVPTEFEYFNVPEDKRHARAAETIDAVLKIWEADGEYDYQGEFHQFKVPAPQMQGGLRVWCKPYQQPHPPIAVAAVSPNSSTIEWAGENGWIPMSTELTHPNLIPTHWEAYKRGAAKTGRIANRRDWRICIDIHVAETTEQARDDVMNHGMARTFDDYFIPLFRAADLMKLIKPDDSVPDDAIDAKWLMDNRWIVGDPEYCLKKIVDYYNFLGGFGTLLLLSQDWDPAEKGLKSLELFAKHIAPTLKEMVPAAGP